MILRLTKTISAAMLLSCIVLFLSATSFAQTTITTYTAVANGNHDASTWQGGNIPPPYLGAIGGHEENLVIPTGITVTLDTNLLWTSNGNHSDVEINGSLIGLPGYYITVRTYVKGISTAVINVDSCTLVGTLTPYYYGHIITNFVRFQDFYLGTGTLTVNKKITIPHSSDPKIYTTLNIGNHCTIERHGWSSLKLGVHLGVSGVINFPDTMSVIFRDMSFQNLQTNIDLDSSWFKKYVDTLLIDIYPKFSNPSLPYTVSIAQKNLYFNGNLIIQSGNLRLNKNKLTFGPDAKLFCTSKTGMIECDEDAEIVVNATSNFGDGFIFYDPSIRFPRKDTIKNFTINMGSNTGSVSINNNLTVAGTLDLKKGQLHVGKAQLRMQSGSSATITNAGPNSYVTSIFGGALHMDVAASATKTFPIGTVGNYAPVSVTNNSSASDIFKAGVVSEILDSATKGLSVSNSEPVVAATWVVDNTAISGANADITLMWPTAMEVNSFDRTMSYVSRFNSNTNKWDTQPSPSASTQSGNFYTHTETVSSFDVFNDDYFAVFDSHTSLANLSVNTITANNKIVLYPNPTTGNATIGMNLETSQTIAVTLTDVSGRIVYSKPATQYNRGKHTITLPTQALTNGLYFVQLTDKDGTLLNSGKLMKQ